MLKSVYLKFRCRWCPTLSVLSLAPLEKAVFRVFNGTRREGDVPLLRLCPAVLPRAGLPRQGQTPAGRQLQDRGAHLPDASSPSRHGQDANLQTPHPPLTPALPGPRGWRLGVPIQKPGYRQCRDAQTWGGPPLDETPQDTEILVYTARTKAREGLGGGGLPGPLPSAQTGLKAK